MYNRSQANRDKVLTRFNLTAGERGAIMGAGRRRKVGDIVAVVLTPGHTEGWTASKSEANQNLVALFV